MWGGLQAEGYLCKFLHEKRMGGVQTTRTLFHIGECSGKCSRRALYRQRKDSAGCLTWGFRFGQSLCALHVDDVPSGSPGEELEHAK